MESQREWRKERWSPSESGGKRDGVPARVEEREMESQRE